MNSLVVPPELILVPAGVFLMGSDPAKDLLASQDEMPQHRVYVPEFRIAKYPVTNAEYELYAKTTGVEFQIPEGMVNHPVIGVSWHEATAYCRWLSDVSRHHFRLPTEAEWEKAARGTTGSIYPWGDMWDPDRLNSYEGGTNSTTPVGRYSPAGDSPYGVADTVGNAWQWTSTLYRPYPYHADDGREIETSSALRVLRGGSFLSDQGDVRCACRHGFIPFGWIDYIGFRVALS